MQIKTLTGHTNPIYTVKAGHHFPLFYTAGNDKGIVEWNINTFEHERIFKPLSSSVYSLEIIDEAEILVAGCNDGKIVGFSLASADKIFEFAQTEAVFDLKWINFKQELLSSSADGTISVYDASEEKLIHRFQSGKEKIRSIAFSEQLNLLAAASNDNQVSIYRLDDYTFLHAFQAHEMGVSSISFSPDGKYLLTGSRDAHLKIWNVSNWHCEHDFTAHLFAIYQINYHPQGQYFATASRDKSIKIWRSDDFSLFKKLNTDKYAEAHKLSVNHIDWSPNGEKLISVGDDKLVKIWDIF